MHPIKCVIVGDGAVGKSCLLASFATNEFPSEYYVPLFSDYWDAPVTIMTGGEQYPLTLVDTAGQEDYVNIRPLYYSQTDVFLVTFSVVLPSSFENVIAKRIPEIRRYCPNTPFILVGTKSDLRNDPGTISFLGRNMQRPVTLEDGEKLAKELKAFKYVDCSALTRKGLKNVFEQASFAALEPTKTKEACAIF